MIYSYIAAFLALSVFCLVYTKLLKPFLEEETATKISNHKYKMLGAVSLIIIVLLGMPVRLESTSMTGKTSFTNTQKSIVEKSEGAKDPLNQDFRKQAEVIKQNQQEIENEINNENPK